LQDRLGKTMDLVGMANLFSHLDKLSRAATQECRRRASDMADETVRQRTSILLDKKNLGGKAWRRLSNHFLPSQKPLAL
jgi:hypothetical protein